MATPLDAGGGRGCARQGLASPYATLLATVLLLSANGALADDYRLAAEDVISVMVLHHPEFSVETVVVRPDGKFNYALTGDIEAAGKTVSEVAEIIRQAVAREVRDPRVSVRLVQRYLEPVYVLGAVQRPGGVEVKDSITIPEAIALAGGLTPSAAPRFGLVIQRAGGETPIDVMAALRGEAPTAQLLLQPGDTLIVSAQFLVSVVGEVQTPGRYPIERGDRVTDVVAAANGLTELSDAREARLVRADGEVIPLDLEAVLGGDKMEDNRLLEPGDVLLVGALEQQVTVVGAVVQPGKYDFDEGERVSDALARAGGGAQDAKLWAATLVRRDGSAVAVDLEAIIQDAAQEHNVALSHGDTLIVPRKVEKVAVVGMVTTPGVVPLEPNMTLMDAIAAAGGWLTNEATPERTLLWRQQDGEPTLTTINARALMLGSTEVENPQLQQGDVVFVTSKHGFQTTDVGRLLIGIAAVLRLFQ